MSLNFITVPTKRLSQSITSASTTFKLNNILGWDSVALTAADFGTQAFAIFRDDSNTLMEIMEIDPATIASTSITILRRGMKFNADVITTEVTANKLDWVKNETLVEIGSNAPHMYQYLKNYIDNAIVSGAADATTSVKGIIELATAAEINAGTAIGGTGASLVMTPNAFASSNFSAAVGAVILLGETTLGADATSVTISGLSSRQFLKIVCYSPGISSTGGQPFVTFNSDSATNYAFKYTVDGAAAAFGSSQTRIELTNTNNTGNFMFTMEVVNRSTYPKIYSSLGVYGASGTGNIQQISTSGGYWNNTSTTITSVTVTSSGNNLLSGTRVSVFGSSN